MPPSREKAQVTLEAAVVQQMPHRIAKTMRGMRSAKEPAAFSTALLTMTGTGCSELMRVSRSGRTNAKAINVMRPAIVFKTTVPTMAFGTCTLGFGTSSHMLYRVQRLMLV
jgi:hypothetical protein